MSTIRDVAKEAGVSISTVSRVMNGVTLVNTETAEKIRAVAKKLNYRPSNIARSLRARRSQTIGLLVSDIQNPFFTAVARGVEDVTQRNGYSLILCNSDENVQKEREYVEVLCAENVGGAIVVPATERSRSFDMFETLGVPFVTVDRRLENFKIDSVLVDGFRGSYEAVTHIISRGYRRIGLISGPLATTTGRQRWEGYRKALKDAGLPFDKKIERFGQFRVDSGAKLTVELLKVRPAVDGFFVANNLMTVGSLTALHSMKIDMSSLGVVGFGDVPWPTVGMDSIATVKQPAYELGSTAAQRLLSRMTKPEQLTNQEIVLQPELCIPE